MKNQISPGASVPGVQSPANASATGCDATVRVLHGKVCGGEVLDDGTTVISVLVPGRYSFRMSSFAAVTLAATPQSTPATEEHVAMNPHECGEEYMTEDAAWARCVLALNHDGDCFGVVLDHDPEMCGADENGDVPTGGCIHAKGHGGKCWDGIGPSPSTRRTDPEAP